jgi:hypothetical protein
MHFMPALAFGHFKMPILALPATFCSSIASHHFRFTARLPRRNLLHFISHSPDYKAHYCPISFALVTCRLLPALFLFQPLLLRSKLCTDDTSDAYWLLRTMARRYASRFIRYQLRFFGC